MRRPVSVVNVVLVALFVLTLVLGLPYIASAMYLYQGHLHLEQAVEGLGLDPRTWDIDAALASPSPPPAEVSRRLDRAVANLHNAMWWDARNKGVYRPLIEAYLLQRNYTGALDAAVTLTQITPEDRDLFVALGNIYAKSGQMEQAVATWNKAGANLSAANQAAWQVNAPLRLRATELLPSLRGGVTPYAIGETEAAVFFIDDILERPLFFPQAGLYSLRVRAQNGTPPPIQIDLRQDGKSVGLLSYSNADNSWGVQEAAVPMSFGLHWIGVHFANDYNAPPVDRNAIVEWIEIAPAK